MILKGMRNDVNRKVNCETANLNKTIEAAVKQIRDIEYIRDTVGLDYLKPTLRDVARLRLDNPDMNLKDIGENIVFKEIIIAPFRISKCDGLPCTIIGKIND